MALFLCPTHGPSPVQFVCAQVHEDYAKGNPLRAARLIRVLLRDISPPDDLWFDTLLCDDCVCRLGIPDGTDTLYDDEVEARYPELHQPHVLCQHCFRQWAESNTQISPLACEGG